MIYIISFEPGVNHIMNEATIWIVSTLAQKFGESNEFTTKDALERLAREGVVSESVAHAALECENSLEGEAKSTTRSRGANCSKSGTAYEQRILENSITYCYRDTGHPLCVQAKTAGSGHGNDVALQRNRLKSHLGLEVKKIPNPDWGQFQIMQGDKLQDIRLNINKKNVETYKVLERLWEDHIKPILLEHQPWKRHGVVPIITKEMKEGNKRDKNTYPELHDIYIEDGIPDDIIAQYYLQKGNQYIQIEKRGLFALGEDIEGFGVPTFSVPTRIRIRAKVHGSNPLSTSWTMAFQPKNDKDIPISPFTLDGTGPAPTNLAKNAV